MRNLVGGNINLSELGRSTVPEGEIARYELNDEDFIFNRTNSADLVGKTGLYKGPRGITFASYLVRFRLNRKLANPDFIALVFASAASQSRIKALATPGVSQYNINPSELQKLFHLPLPPLSEQSHITGLFSTWNDAIEQVTTLITAKQRRKKGLMQQLLTGKRRFREFLKSPWKEYRLGQIFNERTENNRPDLRLLSITADRGVIDRDELDKRDTSNPDKSKYLRIAPGDIGYNTMRMWQGVSALSQLEGIISPAYTVLIPKSTIDAEFAAHLFKLPAMIFRFWRYSQGLVDDTLNLKYPNFAQVHASIPPTLAEQRKIAAVLNTADEEITQLKAQLAALRRQKQGLMQVLLTGKVRVKPKQEALCG
jgi:type I restriction enzyme S subunit